jgi:hypothetical protein
MTPTIFSLADDQKSRNDQRVSPFAEILRAASGTFQVIGSDLASRRPTDLNFIYNGVSASLSGICGLMTDFPGGKLAS